MNLSALQTMSPLIEVRSCQRERIFLAIRPNDPNYSKSLTPPLREKIRGTNAGSARTPPAYAAVDCPIELVADHQFGAGFPCHWPFICDVVSTIGVGGNGAKTIQLKHEKNKTKQSIDSYADVLLAPLSWNSVNNVSAVELELVDLALFKGSNSGVEVN